MCQVIDSMVWCVRNNVKDLQMLIPKHQTTELIPQNVFQSSGDRLHEGSKIQFLLSP